MHNEKWRPVEKDQLSALFFFIFGIIMLVVIIPVGIPVGFIPPGQISPRFLPEVISSAIIVVSAIILLNPVFQRFRKRPLQSDLSVSSGTETAGDEQPEKKPDENDISDPFLKWAPGISILVIAVYLLLLISIGFIISSVFAIVTIMLVFGDRRPWAIAIAAAVVPALVWAFATQLLHIPMP